MDFEMIAPKEVERYLHRQDTFIIDLRSPEEYRDRHLQGALNIPYERRKTAVFFQKNVLLVFYCDRGSLSMAAAREYAGKGYRTRTVVGGLSAYQGKETESFR